MLSNHPHPVLRGRPDVVRKWSDRKVAEHLEQSDYTGIKDRIDELKQRSPEQEPDTAVRSFSGREVAVSTPTRPTLRAEITADAGVG